MFEQRIKDFLKSLLPGLIPVYRSLKRMQFRKVTVGKAFSSIYKKNEWGDATSISGPGSNLLQTETLRQAIPVLLEQLECTVLLDAPCGDFNWMNLVEQKNYRYIGGDIVDELVAENQRRFGAAQRDFMKIDIINDPLPKADVILCRDCFVHFSYADIRTALNNILSSGATYLLTTTFTRRKKNYDIPTGSWRPLNLEIAPFNFCVPIVSIDEHCTENGGIYSDKHLAVWKIRDLPR